MSFGINHQIKKIKLIYAVLELHEKNAITLIYQRFH